MASDDARRRLAEMGMTQAGCSIRAARPWLAALLLAQACSRSPAPERYATRGLVRAREGSGEQLQLAIHHEALPAFKDREGQAAPMSSMVMIFGTTHELAPLPSPGDKVAFEFEVRWDDRPSLLITELRRLPDDALLELASDLR